MKNVKPVPVQSMELHQKESEKIVASIRDDRKRKMHEDTRMRIIDQEDKKTQPKKLMKMK